MKLLDKFFEATNVVTVGSIIAHIIVGSIITLASLWWTVMAIIALIEEIKSK